MKLCRMCLLSLCLAAFSSVAFAADDGSRIHNEYNNSTIYNGTAQPEPRVQQQEEGIRVYRDPETGDRVISVRSRLSNSNNNSYNMPMYIEPRPYIPY